MGAKLLKWIEKWSQASGDERKGGLLSKLTSKTNVCWLLSTCIALYLGELVCIFCFLTQISAVSKIFDKISGVGCFGTPLKHI